VYGCPEFHIVQDANGNHPIRAREAIHLTGAWPEFI
jgi:hypothetical protein